MLKVKEIFNKHTQRYGGLYEIEDETINRIKRNFYSKVQVFRNERQHLDVPDVYFGVTNYDRFQASSFKRDDIYFVSISIGTVRSLMNFFQYLYSHPSFLNGEYGGELEEEKVIDLNFKSLKLIDDFYSFDFDITPLSGIRKSLAFQTFFKAIDYLLIHEYAHITHGHLDYNVQTDNDFMMFEKDVIKKSRMDIRKALEYDADCSSTTINAAPDIMAGWSTHNASIEARNMVVAMYFLFKLPALREYEIEDFKNKTYPSPAQRMSIQLPMLGTLYSELEKTINLNVDELMGVVTDTYFECIKISSKIFSVDARSEKSLFFFSKQSQKHLNVIRESWNKIRDELEHYSYVPIAPVDEHIDLSDNYDYDEISNESRDRNVDGDNPI